VLLVLDNCEEVVAMARRAVDALVEQCPRVHVLVTSRAPLGARGEVRVSLQPLERSAALEMFADRLAETTRGLPVERENDAVHELCRRLDGVPLALELAAAKCRTLTPRELLVRLERRANVLADTVGRFDERHRDLDQLIDWSWNELSPLAQRVVGRLTVVIGGFTVDAAEAIASGDGIDDSDVDRALEELEESGLILRDATEADVRHRGPGSPRRHSLGRRRHPQRRTPATRRPGVEAGLMPLLVAEGDPRAGEVVGRELHLDPVPGKDADPVLAHLAAEVAQHGVAVVEDDAEMTALQGLFGLSLEDDRIFLLLRHAHAPLHGSRTTPP
jgi:hypothetical protein